MSSILIENWLTEELKQEIIDLFQPSYDHQLTDTDITAIAKTLTNTVDLWIKFNWRIDHAQ